MSHRVVIPKSAQKQLDLLFQPARGRILQRVAALATDPRPRGSVKLQGQTDEYKHRREVYRRR